MGEGSGAEDVAEHAGASRTWRLSSLTSSVHTRRLPPGNSVSCSRLPARSWVSTREVGDNAVHNPISCSRLTAGTRASTREVGGDHAIIAAVRRALEGMEKNLNSHLAKEITRVQMHGDRLREAAISRVDDKVGVLEAARLKLDRRVAELDGHSRGMSEEMQSQIRRVDAMDAELFEWRKRLEEEFHTKVSDLEQKHAQLTSSVRVSTVGHVDAFKNQQARLARVEETMEGVAAHSQDLSDSVMNLHDRLLQCEEAGTHGRDLRSSSSPEKSDQTFLQLLEQQRSDALLRMADLEQETCELRSMVQRQQENFRHVRTLLDTKEEQFKGLRAHVDRENWDGKMRALTERLQKLEAGGTGMVNHLDVLQRKPGHEHFSKSPGHGHCESPETSGQVEKEVIPCLSPGKGRCGFLDTSLDLVEKEVIPCLSVPSFGGREMCHMKSLPPLSEEHAVQIQSLARRGTIQIIHHHTAEQLLQPIPGSRFVVVDDPPLLSHKGALVEPAANEGEWAVRLDNGTRAKLDASNVHVAPQPMVSLLLSEPLDFVGVQRFGPASAVFEDEEKVLSLLADAAQVLRMYDECAISIEGHTATPDDEIDAWAHELAQNRAEKVKAAFMAFGVDDSRLKTVGLPGKLGSRKDDVVIKIVSF